MSHLNAQIVRLYDTVFDRAPDAEGLEFWNGATHNGFGLDYMADRFIAAQEFATTYGQPGNLAFVRAMYRNILGRDGEPEGVAFWTAALDEGRSDRSDILVGFSESPEHIAQMAVQYPPTTVRLDQFETYLLQLINKERAKLGAAALAFDPELVNAAERHSTRMDDFNFIAHRDPVDGSSVSTRVTDAGYGWRGVGENIAYIGGSNAAMLGNSDVERLHTNLMNSSGHRANILRSDWQEIGLAFDLGEHNGRPAIFLTEVFGLPTSAEYAERDIWG